MFAIRSILLIAALFTSASALAAQVFRGKIENYPGEFAVFKSENYTPESMPVIDLHLHGHLRAGETFDSTLKLFDFDRILAKSGRKNTLLVVLESTGKCITYKEVLATAESYEKFQSSLLQKLIDLKVLQSADRYDLLVSGHSGAYNPIADMIGHKAVLNHLKGVILLDATYGRFEEYRAFIHNHPSIPFIAGFLSGSRTDEGSKQIMPDSREYQMHLLKVSKAGQSMPSEKYSPLFVKISWGLGKDHWGMVSALMPQILSYL